LLPPIDCVVVALETSCSDGSKIDRNIYPIPKVGRTGQGEIPVDPEIGLPPGNVRVMFRQASIPIIQSYLEGIGTAFIFLLFLLAGLPIGGPVSFWHSTH